MFRRFIIPAVPGLVIVLLIRTWLVLGIFAPVMVSGSSMAPTLCGSHQEVACPQCQTVFRVGVSQWPKNDQLDCAACGNRWRHTTPVASQRSGDRLWVDRLTFQLREPRRWEIVVFRCPDAPSQLCVKRVVGLPGETVRLRDGDVFVDDHLVQKTLSQQRAVRQPVHRMGQGPDRWKAEKEFSHWKKHDNQWRFVPANSKERNPMIQWLRYHHLGGYAITDNVSYNQNVSRELNRVNDIMLSCELSILDFSLTDSENENDQEFHLRATIESNEFELIIHPRTGQVALKKNEELVAQEMLTEARFHSGQKVQLDFSLFDQQALLALDSKTVLVHPYQSTVPRSARPQETQSQSSTTNSFSLGARGLSLTVEALTVWRDIYYARPATPVVHGFDSPCRLGQGEYFLLGDNCPISKDSRAWLRPGIPAKLLLGKPL